MTVGVVFIRKTQNKKGGEMLSGTVQKIWWACKKVLNLFGLFVGRVVCASVCFVLVFIAAQVVYVIMRVILTCVATLLSLWV